MFQFVEAIKRVGAGLAALGSRRLIALAITGFSVFLLVGVSAYFLSRPQQEILYAGLEIEDVTRIGAALEDAGIGFDVNPAGDTVLVNFGQAPRARMLLAQKGLPRSDSAGYELFDKLGSLGLTSFMQQVTRVRALEGELSKTIRLIDGVRSARVHLALRNEGSFRSADEKSTASVIIRADGDSGIAAASAIRHLVAASIAGLSPEQVTVMSADGRLLASADDGISAAPEKLIELERNLALDMENKLTRTLLPYLGLGNFQISVSAKLNTDRQQISETIFDPNSRVERSMRVIKESGEAQNSTSENGVTGEQNIPVDQTGNANGETSNEKKDRKEELTNFEINSKSVSRQSEGYTIDRVALAIVVNRNSIKSSLGENPTEEMVKTRISELETLAGTAVGLVRERGDTITVSAVDFIALASEEETETSSDLLGWLKDNSLTFMNMGMLLLITLLVLFVGLRPAIKSIMSSDGNSDRMSSTDMPALGSMTADMPAADMAIASSALDNFGMSQLQSNQNDPLLDELARDTAYSPKDRLAKIVELDPDRAAEVLKKWLDDPLELVG